MRLRKTKGKKWLSAKTALGFTIIEMLVTMSVLTVLGGILILYSRAGESTTVLLRELAKISSDINRAKNLALTTTTFVDQEGNKINPCGYGVYFDLLQNQYTIFADLASDCATSSHLRDPEGNADVETISLSKPLELKSTEPDQVFFLAPDPTVIFPDAATEMEIRLGPANGAIMSVKVTKTGQVSTY
ncbi:MAG TPA: prepilin-type N-terminal cleavage/methylation domain-containing protein [Candidatus Paceibacterota bacterium]|nr:prepilin-type N-terminal cleavage/methylation domain-containing protein [Candidatus Paceibacterota bacterium]HRY76666.1 prepilin-type N-terminal cleavage/methylation domain-containing protein [Candidatus Paceibacterota bacterium]